MAHHGRELWVWRHRFVHVSAQLAHGHLRGPELSAAHVRMHTLLAMVVDTVLGASQAPKHTSGVADCLSHHVLISRWSFGAGAAMPAHRPSRDAQAGRKRTKPRPNSLSGVPARQGPQQTLSLPGTDVGSVRPRCHHRRGAGGRRQCDLAWQHCKARRSVDTESPWVPPGVAQSFVCDAQCGVVGGCQAAECVPLVSGAGGAPKDEPILCMSISCSLFWTGTVVTHQFSAQSQMDGVPEEHASAPSSILEPAGQNRGTLSLQWQEEHVLLVSDPWDSDCMKLLSIVSRETVSLFRRDFSGWPLQLEYADGMGVVDDGHTAQWAQDFLRFSVYRDTAEPHELHAKDGAGTAMTLDTAQCRHHELVVRFSGRRAPPRVNAWYFLLPFAGAAFFWSAKDLGHFCGWILDDGRRGGARTAEQKKQPPSKDLHKRYHKWSSFLQSALMGDQLRKSAPYAEPHIRGEPARSRERVLQEPTLGTCVVLALLVRSGYPRHAGGLVEVEARQNCESLFLSLLHVAMPVDFKFFVDPAPVWEDSLVWAGADPRSLPIDRLGQVDCEAFARVCRDSLHVELQRFGKAMQASLPIDESGRIVRSPLYKVLCLFHRFPKLTALLGQIVAKLGEAIEQALQREWRAGNYTHLQPRSSVDADVKVLQRRLPFYANAAAKRHSAMLSFTADNSSVGKRRRMMFALVGPDNVAAWGPPQALS